MKKRLLRIILLCLGSLTLIALSYGKERIANPISVSNFSEEKTQAESLINSIVQEEKLDSEISNAARKAIQLGHYNYARQQIEIIEDIPLKIQLWRELAEAYLSVGQTQQAFSIINQAVALDKQNNSFESITWVRDWLLTGQEEKVQEMISNLRRSEEQQVQIYLSLAQSYLEVGKLQSAFDLAQLIPPDTVLVPDEYPDPKNQLLQKIIEQALHKKNFELASQVADIFSQPVERFIALRKIAKQYFIDGKSEEGKEKLEQAFSVAKITNSIPVIVDRHAFWNEPNAKLLFELAQDYQSLGEPQKAVEILDLATKSIKNFKTQLTFDVVVWNRSQAFRQLAFHYLKFGEKEKAIATLTLATQEAKKFRRKREVFIKELLAIATMYLDLDNQKEAANLWQEAFYKLKIIDPKSAELILETAKIAVLVGHPEEGRKLVEQTQSFLMQLEIASLAGEEKLIEKLAQQQLQQINQLSIDDKIIALEQIALSLAENEKIALNLAEKIDNPFERAYFLVFFSKNYAQKNNWKVVNNILDRAIIIVETIPEQKQQEQWFRETTNGLIKINQGEENFLEEEQVTIPLWQLQLAERVAKKSNSSKLINEVLLIITKKELIEINEETALNSFNKNLNYLQKSSGEIEFTQDWLPLFNLAIKHKKNDFALAIAQNILHPDYKIVALRQVAQKYVINDNKEKAKMILSEVIKIAQTVDNNNKEELIQGITEQQNQIQ